MTLRTKKKLEQNKDKILLYNEVIEVMRSIVELFKQKEEEEREKKSLL